MKKMIYVFMVSCLLLNACKNNDEVDLATITAEDFEATVAENQTVGALIGKVNAKTDQGTLTFTIVTQSIAGAVAINSEAGTITVANASVFNFEVNQRITGQIKIQNAGVEKSINFVINIQDRVEIVASNFVANVDENTPNGTLIGKINAQAGQAALQFGLTAQSVPGAFAIDANTGELSVANQAVLDFETHENITGQISVTSTGVEKMVDFTVAINDVREINASDFADNINENSADGTVVGTITATTDQGILGFSIVSQSVNGALAIDARTGQLSVANGIAFDFETNPSITGKVKITNAEVAKEINFTVNLNNLQPQITIQENNVEVAHNTLIDFGEVAFTKVKTFTIKNTGQDDLQLSATPFIKVLEADSEFSISQQPDHSSIGVNESVTFEVTFTPRPTTSDTNATISIESNAPNQSIYTIRVKGSRRFVAIKNTPAIRFHLGR